MTAGDGDPAALEQMIQEEVFAQLGAICLSNPEHIQSLAPSAFEAMQAIAENPALPQLVGQEMPLLKIQEPKLSPTCRVREKFGHLPSPEAMKFQTTEEVETLASVALRREKPVKDWAERPARKTGTVTDLLFQVEQPAPTTPSKIFT